VAHTPVRQSPILVIDFVRTPNNIFEMTFRALAAAWHPGDAADGWWLKKWWRAVATLGRRQVRVPATGGAQETVADRSTNPAAS